MAFLVCVFRNPRFQRLPSPPFREKSCARPWLFASSHVNSMIIFYYHKKDMFPIDYTVELVEYC